MSLAEVSYSEARIRLAELWDQVVADREPIRLTRRGRPPVMLMTADEYEGLIETVRLLRSPANARRLIAAVERAQVGEGAPRLHRKVRPESG